MKSSIEPHRAEFPADALPELPRVQFRLVLDRVRSAHNVGAVFRTSDAAAIELIYLLGLTPHPPHPQVEKTALGSTLYVPWVHRSTNSEVLQELEQDGYSLVALDNGPGSISLWDFSWPRKVALVAGNEVDGVSSEMLESCQNRIFLPMHGYKRSLNVTTAFGIAVYDYIRTFRCGQGLIIGESEETSQ